MFIFFLSFIFLYCLSFGSEEEWGLGVNGICEGIIKGYKVSVRYLYISFLYICTYVDIMYTIQNIHYIDTIWRKTQFV